VQPQARIYVQLAKSCADLNYAKKALEVYQAMARAALDGKVQVHESINLRLHRYCSSCGRGEEASFLFNTVSNLQRGAPPALKHHAVQ